MANAKKDKELVSFLVPRKGKEETMFVGVNFKNYILKRGERVSIPKEVYEVIVNAEGAEAEAEKYALERENAYFEKAQKR